jgi:hypothetical protein
MEKEIKTIVPNQEEMFKQIDEINLRSNGDWKKMCFEDRKALVKICKAYKESTQKYTDLIFTLAAVTEEQLIEEEKFRGDVS